MIGTVLNNRYQLGDELGQGGMGTVYRAHDTMLDRDVAVKMLSSSGLGTEGRARLLQEAQAVARLNHPNIVTVHDAGELDGAPYIVMEYVEGKSLQEEPPKEFKDIVQVTRHICAALEHAHDNQVIHRDLKPENVIVEADGTAKLMDFGLARSMASRVSVEGDIVGTVFYLAPEQAMGRPLDGRADLYSLGVMLYELTSGELPFLHEDPLAVVSQHLHATVLPPRAKNPKIPPLLEQLILKLLEKDPADRPGSAAAVVALLDSPDLLDPEAETDKELSVISRILRGRFVGRQAELNQAKSVWGKALGGSGQTLLISGEPGIGKTRLMRELATHVEVSGGRALVGECYAEGGAPYAPFAQIVRRALREPSQNGFRLSDFVLADMLTLAPELRQHYPEVPLNPPLQPEAEQQRLFENFVSFCESLAENWPLMLVIDDAHWGDSSTLSMLRHLARRIRRQRTLLVATYREVELDVARPLHEVLLDINRARLATRLKLERFSQEQTHDLLHAIFEEDITPEFLEGIHRETEGNPFFIEEVCKALVEDSKIYYENGRWHRPSMDELEIPQSVRVAIQTRVARLPEEHREVLSLAAVLGREFEFEVLAKASDLDEDSLIEALEAAETAQLIEEVGGADEARFSFAHALIPLALVEGVRKLRRRKLHLRAAEAVAALHPEDYEALAHHYSEAGSDPQAATYFAKAGVRAQHAYANAEAARHFRSALDLTEDAQDRMQLHEALGTVLSWSGQFEQAIESWQQAISLSEPLELVDDTARLYALAARAAWEGGNHRRGLQIARQGLTAVGEAQDGPGLANLLHETARARFFSGDREEGTRIVQQALEMARRVKAVKVIAEAMVSHGTFSELSAEEGTELLEQAAELAHTNQLPDQEARARNNLAVVCSFALGDFERAIEQLEICQVLAKETAQVSMEIFYGANAQWFRMFVGDLTGAEQELSRLLELGSELGGQLTSQQMVESYRGCARRMLGKHEQALTGLRDCYRAAAEVNNSNNLFIASVFLADLALEIDRELELAQQALDKALEVSYGESAWMLSLSARISARLGDMAQARQRLEQAREVWKVEPGKVAEMMLALAEAEIALAEGEVDQASHQYARAVDLARQHRLRWHLANTKMRWAESQMAPAQGQMGEPARTLLDEARSEFGAMGVPNYVERIDQLLSGSGAR